MKHHPDRREYLSGKRVLPKPITKESDLASVIDNMDAYNGGRLRAACQLMRDRYAQEDVTIGLSIAGALTPAGLGPSTIIPLMNHGFVDWMVATGANMYHDLHFAFNMPLFRGSHTVDDADLRDKGVTRIYDILFDYQDVLMATDRILRKIMLQPEFQKEMGTRNSTITSARSSTSTNRRTIWGGQRPGGGIPERDTGVHIFTGGFHHRNECGGTGTPR